MSIPVIAQQRPAPPPTPRIYIFDNGRLTGLDPKMFGFTREEVKEPRGHRLGDSSVQTTAGRHRLPAVRRDVLRPLHYHADHTANASEFAGATWIVQKAERDAMFAPEAPGMTRPADDSALQNAKINILDNADFDVFGDATVMVKATPGHTPGHQVLFVKLAKTGPVVLAGDLYHYPEEMTTGRVPPFEWNADQAKASRQGGLTDERDGRCVVDRA